ncbi:MAG: MFS transporter [Chloroflexota bacterium]
MYNRNTSIRLTGTLFVTQSLLSAANIGIATLLAIIAADLAGESLAGIPSTITTLSIAIAALPMGIFMGRFGRRAGLTLSYSLGLFGAIIGIFAVVHGLFWLLLVSSAVLGFGRAGGEQSRFVAGDLFFEHERARMIGVIVFAGTMGAVVGPLLVEPGIWLATQLNLAENSAPWILAAIFSGIATVLVFLLLRPEPLDIAKIIETEDTSRRKKKRELTDDDNQDGRPIRELLRLPRVQLAVISMLLSQVVMVMLMVMTPLHMANHGHSEGSIGFVISAHVLGMFGFSWLTGYFIDRFGRITMMIAAAITLIVSAVIAPLGTQLPFLVIGLFLLGLGWNFGYVAGSSLLSDALDGAEQTRMQGANDMLVAGAAALGSFSSGPLFATSGYISIAGVGIVIALLFIWLVRLLSPADTEITPDIT